MKLRRKILSAGLALGATALTLTTSTFAWYTANTEVTMTGATGVSASNGDSLLLISSVATDGTFKNSVSLGLTTSGMQPVEYNAAAGSAASYKPTFYSFSDGAVDTSAAAPAAHYLDFDLYFKSTAAKTVYLKVLNVSNTTTSAAWGEAAKDVLSTTGLPSGWDVAAAGKATYKVDLMRALKIAFYSETHSGTAGDAGATKVKGEAYDLSTLAHKNTLDDSETTYAGTYNAHEYYEAVTGKDLDDNKDGTDGSGAVVTALTTSDTVTLGITPASTATNNDLHVHFYFFIDGWDTDCFDAVQGQTFTVNMTFSTESGTIAAA